MSDVIKSFLVSLGYQNDAASMSSFLGGIATATISVKAVDMALGFAKAAITGMVNSVPELAKEMWGMSWAAKAAGTSMEELGKLEYIAVIMDSSKEAVRSSMSEISKNAGLAAMGMGLAKAMFDEVGISVKDADGKLKNSATLLKEIGAAVKGMEKGQAKAVLERLGIDSSMLETLTSDVSDLGAEFDKMSSAAGMDLEQLAADGNELGNNIDRIKMGMEIMHKSILSKFVGPVGKAVKYASDMLIKAMPQILAALRPIADFVVKFGTIASKVFAVWIGWIGKAVDGLKYVYEGFVKLDKANGGWLKVIGGVILAWKLLNMTFLASPIGMVIGLAAAIALLVDDFQTWKEGGDSLINWGRWEPAIDAAMGAIKALWSIIEGLGEMIGAWVSVVVSLLTGDFAGAWESVKGYIGGVIKVFESLWGVVSKVGETIGMIAGGIADVFSSDKKKAPGAIPPAQSPMLQPGAAGAIAATKLTGAAGAIAATKLTPSPATAAQLGGGQNINQKTQIIVEGAGDPKSVAREVGKQQNRINQDMTRNFQPVAS